MSNRITRVFNEPPYDPDRDQEAKSETGKLPLAGVGKKNKKTIFNFMRSISFRWWCLIFLAFIIIAAAVIWCLLVYISRKEIFRQKDEVLPKIQDIISARYGNIEKKKNGFDYLNGLPDMLDIIEATYEDWDDHDNNKYFQLSLDRKKERLNKLELFKRCEDIRRIFEYDMIAPEYYRDYLKGNLPAGFDWHGDYCIGLIKTKNAVQCLCLAAEYYLEKGDRKKGIQLFIDCFRFIDMLPREGLIDVMINAACRSILIHAVLKYHKQYNLSELKDFSDKISRICIADSGEYFQWFLWEIAFSMEFYLEYHSMMAGLYTAESVKQFRKGYDILKANIDRNDFMRGIREAEKFAADLKKHKYLHIVSIVAFPSLLKSIISLGEGDAEVMLALIGLRSHMYKLENGKYPGLFSDMFKEDEFDNITIHENGRKMLFRGYMFGFINTKSDGTEYNTPENRRTGCAVFAAPREYQLTGQTMFIIHEDLTIYSQDTGASGTITQWPKDIEKEGWINDF